MSIGIGDVFQNRFVKKKKAEVVSVRKFDNSLTEYRLHDRSTGVLTTWNEFELNQCWQRLI